MQLADTPAESSNQNELLDMWSVIANLRADQTSGAIHLMEQLSMSSSLLK